MRDIKKAIFTFSCIVTCILLIVPVCVVLGQSGENFVASATGNSLWVLNKSTKKLMFVQFKKKGKVWKSHPIDIPPNYNVEECRLQSYGRRGTALLLFDISAGLATAYSVQGDHSVKKGADLSFTPNDKKFLVAGRWDKFWILNRSSREIILVEFSAAKRAIKYPPVIVPQSFNLTECQLEVVGGKGEGVSLFDRSSGMTTFYKHTYPREGSDGPKYSIQEYLSVDLGDELK